MPTITYGRSAHFLFLLSVLLPLSLFSFLLFFSFVLFFVVSFLFRVPVRVGNSKSVAWRQKRNFLRSLGHFYADCLLPSAYGCLATRPSGHDRTPASSLTVSFNKPPPSRFEPVSYLRTRPSISSVRVFLNTRSTSVLRFDVQVPYLFVSSFPKRLTIPLGRNRTPHLGNLCASRTRLFLLFRARLNAIHSRRISTPFRVAIVPSINARSPPKERTHKSYRTHHHQQQRQ